MSNENNSMDFGYFPNDLRRRACYNGFSRVSFSSEFGFPDNRLCQNLYNFDEARSDLTGTRPFMGYSRFGLLSLQNNHVIELGINPFGNYLIQRLLQVCNEEQRTQILIMLTSRPGLLVEISLNTYGTRVVQKLIETVSTKAQISLVKAALKPGFLSLVRDLNGHHVILSCLTCFAPNDTKFILEAATMFCTEIATHCHGCRVLQRCVSHSVGVEREQLVAEIARNSLLLAQDAFGNYVVQYIIEQKMEGVSVMFELRGSYVKLAKQKFSSHVVEQCLRHYPESRYQVVHELVSVPNFEHLLQDPYANYVIQTALSVTKGFVRVGLVDKVKGCRNLWKNPYYKKIFSKSRLLKM